MRGSTDRIITSHVGSLPRAPELFSRLQLKETGQPHDVADLEQMVRQSVADVVTKQRETEIDVVNDGEHSKSSWNTYASGRLAGFMPIDAHFGFAGQSRDERAFPRVYADQRAMWAARPLRQSMPRKRQVVACTEPVRYIGHADVRRDIENLKAGIDGRPVEEAFITALSPTNVALYYPNHYYPSEEEYQIALADAMREEYRAIVNAGMLVQIDDPRLATHYDRNPALSIEDCRGVIRQQVEVINYALKGIEPGRVRFHTCYSTNIAPRVHDLELRHYVDLLLQINAGGYSFEAANPRHEHEWQVWEAIDLPEGKVLLPGVVSHCVAQVEHPELVAQRIVRFAKVVGRERVIASSDCGFASSGAGDEVHPDVAWEKLRSLVAGGRLASGTLWN